jgi:predicted secreted hydrolase
MNSSEKLKRGIVAVGIMGALSIPKEALATPDSGAFQSAKPDYDWSFPRDHGPHEKFQSEWWYYTGHLFAQGGEPFRDAPLYGFQLTFFRRSDSPGEKSSSEYLAHAALTDIRSGVTKFSVRRGGALFGAAGANPRTLEVWSGDWLAEMVNDTQVLRFSPEKSGGAAVRLIGKVSNHPMLQGENGFSRKGGCETCASHYYSFPRIPLSGEVRDPAGIQSVVGLGWMDHEFMSNTLQADQVGWDWLGLMLRDGRSITVFRLRDARGGTSYASANIVKDNSSELISGEEILLTPSEEWKSLSTGARYPLLWRLQIPSRSIDITVRARVPACEIGGDGAGEEPRYWEGPVAASDESVIGYLEMTGYAGKVQL